MGLTAEMLTELVGTALFVLFVLFVSVVFVIDVVGVEWAGKVGKYSGPFWPQAVSNKRQPNTSASSILMILTIKMMIY